MKYIFTMPDGNEVELTENQRMELILMVGKIVGSLLRPAKVSDYSSPYKKPTYYCYYHDAKHYKSEFCGEHERLVRKLKKEAEEQTRDENVMSLEELERMRIEIAKLSYGDTPIDQTSVGKKPHKKPKKKKPRKLWGMKRKKKT